MCYRAISKALLLLTPFFVNAHDIDQDDIYDMIQKMDYMAHDVMKETNAHAKRSIENWLYGTWTLGDDTFSASFPSEPKEVWLDGQSQDGIKVLLLRCDVDETTNYSILSVTSEKPSSVQSGQIIFQQALDTLLNANVHIIYACEEECSYLDDDIEDDITATIFFYDKDENQFCKNTYITSDHNAYVLSSNYKWHHLNQHQDFVKSFRYN